MTETPLLLAGDFATPSQGDWEAEVLKILNRRRPEGKELNLDQAMDRLRTTTVDGLSIDPLYTSHDGTLGEPGVEPFTRGTTIRTGSLTGWEVCALHEDPEIAFSNKEVLADLERGATSLWLRTGADAISVTDLPAILDGVDSDIAAISVSSYDDQQAAARALLSYFSATGSHHASGNLGVDALAFAARNGGRPEFGSEAEWVRAAMAEY
ncbi:MAG TPA: methylmalonyl-CoA mutase small subunit, partial [Propionibacteriaceae bacterium]|nr:methylmalonyl-CoA mutase small subunit [Propionibacteriaceae bacterium]